MVIQHGRGLSPRKKEFIFFPFHSGVWRDRNIHAVTGSDNYNKVLSGLPSYATKSPCLEDQGFIFPAPSAV